jgi:hypothetical protein
MTTFFLCALFVYGVHTVIHHTAEFFGLDLFRFYEGKKATVHPRFRQGEVDYQERPIWQQFFLRPLMICNVCMSSVWGSVFYVMNFGFTDPAQWVFHCVISAAIIFIINQILKINVSIDYR